MIVYIYDNGFCDPLNNVGTCRAFEDSKDIDAFVNFFVASMAPNAVYSGRFQIFITDNTISFEEMDHHVLMNEGYQLEFRNKAIEEVAISEVARQVNKAFSERDKQLAAAKRKAEKARKDARERSTN